MSSTSDQVEFSCSGFLGEGIPLQPGDVIMDPDHEWSMKYRNGANPFAMVVVGTANNFVYLLHEDGSFEEHRSNHVYEWTRHGWVVFR